MKDTLNIFSHNANIHATRYFHQTALFMFYMRQTPRFILYIRHRTLSIHTPSIYPHRSPATLYNKSFTKFAYSPIDPHKNPIYPHQICSIFAKTLQHYTATVHCNSTLQHYTATVHCNTTLQHYTRQVMRGSTLKRRANWSRCNTLHHTATQCNTQQHDGKPWNTRNTTQDLRCGFRPKEKSESVTLQIGFFLFEPLLHTCPRKIDRYICAGESARALQICRV